jgi:hypothetical protein
MLRRTAVVLAVWGTCCSAGIAVRAEPIKLEEATTDQRVFRVESQVQTRGKLIVSEGAGKTQSLPIESTAAFRFNERRLPPAGRDALALRAVREFEAAAMNAKVAGGETGLSLDPAATLVVTSGQINGLQSYALRTLLTDDQLDLLNLLADPLALAAILPAEAVEVGAEWTAPEWAAQLLAGVEAVETARLTVKLSAVEGNDAQLTLQGQVQGLQEGARTTIELHGDLIYDLAGQHLQTARVDYKIMAAIGAVAPGVEAEASVTVSRQPAFAAGSLNDNVVAVIPLEAPRESLRLVFDAAPWRARLKYDRDWHVFRAVLDEPPKVAILRLIQQGSLIVQCNVSPIPDAAPGQHTPMEQYQQDIQTVLGKSFRSIKTSEEVPLPDGGTRLTVVALGEVERTGKNKEGQTVLLPIPMEWRYTIIADHSGRQMSFVFALEQALAEQFGRRDLELIESLEFVR